MVVAKKRGRGRPKVPDEVRKRNNVTIRLRDQVKADLEAAAAKNQRSLSEEIEARMERSFRDDRLLPEILAAAYGGGCAALVLMIARAMHEAGTSTGFMSTFTLEGSANWVDHPYAFHMARMAAARVLDRAAPEGEPVPPPALQGDGSPEALKFLREQAGVGYANSVIDASLGEGVTGDLQRWGGPIRALLPDQLFHRLARQAPFKAGGK